jgi:hypothetical protein
MELTARKRAESRRAETERARVKAQEALSRALADPALRALRAERVREEREAFHQALDDAKAKLLAHDLAVFADGLLERERSAIARIMRKHGLGAVIAAELIAEATPAKKQGGRKANSASILMAVWAFVEFRRGQDGKSIQTTCKAVAHELRREMNDAPSWSTLRGIYYQTRATFATESSLRLGAEASLEALRRQPSWGSVSGLADVLGNPNLKHDD